MAKTETKMSVFAAGVIKGPIDFAVFCIARTYMRLLDTHVVCYATVCARTVRIMGWGVGVVAYAGMGCMIDRHSSARQSLVAFEKKCAKAKKPVQ